jgi:hypothetical protein
MLDEFEHQLLVFVRVADERGGHAEELTSRRGYTTGRRRHLPAIAVLSAPTAAD